MSAVLIIPFLKLLIIEWNEMLRKSGNRRSKMTIRSQNSYK